MDNLPASNPAAQGSTPEIDSLRNKLHGYVEVHKFLICKKERKKER